MENKKYLFIAAVLIVIIGTFLILSKNTGKKFNLPTSPTPSASNTATPTTTALSIALAEQNNSGENGLVTLTEQNEKVLVSIKLAYYPPNTAQPAHIHTGDCENPGEIEYGLSDVVNGGSETLIATNLADLVQNPPLILNIHMSSSESNTYVACGEITSR